MSEPPPEPTISKAVPAARAGDGDREAVADRLRVAAGDGRIDLAELDDRLGRAFGAKTYGELDELVADLPQGRPMPASLDEGNDPDTLVIDTTTANIKQNGQWNVPRRIVARCTSALVKIDFTKASCAHREVTVEATCGSGWITLIVPHGWGVRIDAASTNTANIHNKVSGPADPSAPTLNVIGHPGVGYVRIKQPR
ncbi:MAG TPA: DUF1707 domain-containing protein [Streptosporangiaceae bacterium]